MSKKHISIALLFSSLTFASPAFAGWSLGAGYHNPPGATYGLNFMYLWTNWAFELGIGYIGKTESVNTDANKKTTQDANYSVAGDLNMKYLFRAGSVFRPYFVGGFGAGVATSSGGTVSAGASITHPFGGGGFYLMGQSAYFYLGALIVNAAELQAGIGFNF